MLYAAVLAKQSTFNLGHVKARSEKGKHKQQAMRPFKTIATEVAVGVVALAFTLHCALYPQELHLLLMIR